MMDTLVITAAAGFLVAVLWFDLMFDVQVWRYRRSADLPAPVLDSIAGYYHRVTTSASPMGRLVGLVMVTLLVALVVQAVGGHAPWWVSAVSLPAAVLAIGLAAARIFRQAQRLGSRTDPINVQSGLARDIFRAHVICLVAMATLLAVQLAGS
jgi:hypothetical protein